MGTASLLGCGQLQILYVVFLNLVTRLDGLTLACPPGHCTRTDSGLTLTVLSSVSSPSIHRHPARAVVLDGKCLSPHLCILIISWKCYFHIKININILTCILDKHFAHPRRTADMHTYIEKQRFSPLTTLPTITR